MSESSHPLTHLDSRDLRRGGSWTRRQWLKNTLLLFAIRGALFVVDRMPLRLLVALGAALGRVCHALLQSMRRRAQQRALALFPEGNVDRLVRSSFENAGRNLARCLALRRQAPAALDLVEVDAATRQVLDAALADGRGVVFVSPHLGPFELIAAAIAELGHRPAALVRESYDPRLDAIVDRHRTLRGVGVIHRGKPGAAIGIVRALRDGRPVGFLPDLQSRVPCVGCRFLGQRWQLPVGPQRIAIRAGCPLLVGSLSRAAGSAPAGRPKAFRLEIQRIEPTDDDEIMTQRVADALSRAIERMPDHWLWMA